MRTTKWIMAAVVLMALGFVGSVDAQQHTKKYTLYLGTSDTGVTTPRTVDLSGVTSPLVIDNGGDYKRRATDTTLKGLSSLPSGNAILYIDEVTVSQAQIGLGGDYTGNTFFVCAKFGHAGSNFSLLEKIPLTPLGLALSGNTAYGMPFQIPRGTEAAQFFFGPSGVTHYGNFKGSLIVGLPADGFPSIPPILLQTLTFTGPTASGGTIFSSADSNGNTMPDGTRRIEAMATTSGVSVIYSPSGTPNTAGGSQHIPGETEKTFTGSLQTLKDYTIRILGTGYLVVECWTREED